MKTETKVLILSAAVGALLWIGDAAVDSLFFSKKPFLDLLVLDITPYELYMRTTILLALVAVGMVTAALLRRERLAREKLTETQRRFDAFMDNLPGIAFMRDREGRFVFVNRFMAGILGKTLPEIRGRGARDLLPADVAVSSMEEDRAILESGRSFQGENLIHHPDGSRHWMVHKFPIPDREGAVALVGGISLDITELKAAEKALRESEERYRALFNNTNDGILMVNSEGGIIEVNEVLCRRLQYTREEMLSKRVRDLDPPEFARLVPERTQVILGTGSAVFETAHLRRDGTSIPTEVSSRTVALRGGTAILSIARDITERKAAEKALREAEELYRTLVENLGEGVGIMDSEETFLFANPAGEVIFGVPRGGLAGRNLKEFMSDEELQRAKEGTRQRRQGLTGTYENRIVRPDGSERVLLVTATPKRDASGDYVATLGVFSDVTEVRRAEEALRLSEQRYRTILEDMEEGYYEVDLKGTITFANEAFGRIWGLTRDELVGRNFRSLMAPENAERTYAAFNRVFKSGQPAWTTDWQTIRRDGSLRALDASIYPIRASDGLYSGFRGVLRDVTDRLAAEKALRESEERYRDLVEHSVDVILTHDLSGRILSCNPAAARFLGLDSPEEGVGLNLREVLAPSARDLFTDYLEAMRREGRAKGFMRVLTRSGGERTLAYENTLKTDADQGAIVRARAQDVTDMLAMEAALKESESRYRLLFERNLAGVYRSSLDGRLLECNPACARLLGFNTPEEAKGQPTLAFYRDPKDRLRLRELLLKTGSATNVEVPLKTRDGRPFLAIENATLVHDPTGTDLIEGTIIDITERRRLEAEMARVKDLETMARLTGGVAHEVRNPLFAIQVNLAALARRLSLEPEAKVHMDHVLVHVKRLENLMRSLIDLGRSIGPSDLEQADLRALVRNACDTVERELPDDHRVRFELAGETGPVPIRASIQRLTQAFVYILRNAAQASPPDGVVRMSCRHEAGTCEALITDSGPGIPDTIRDTLFEPFVTTRTGQPGIGLALARHYVQSHGGTIEASDNVPPPGATFTVRLPVMEGSKDG
ncbi:MAG: PAS domain S-box protein [Acidobacteriota bacterium]